MKIQILEDLEQCRVAWNKYWPVKTLFDLWPVRQCFHRSYERPLSFRLAEQGGQITGFLPLAWNEEQGEYVFFPAETWKGETWLEQNRLIAHGPDVFRAIADSVDAPMHLRYVNQTPLIESIDAAGIDETGYLFYPGMYDFSMDNFWLSFPGKSRKKLRAEIKKFETGDVSFRFDHLPDLAQMFRMNMVAFRSESYFSDARFYRSFERLSAFLWDMGMLRITTILIKDKIAAVDMGAVFNNAYTLVAGATDPEFCGIAKVINLHHLEWSCRKRFKSVDFLCGNFNWKQRFHLSQRPLYEIRLGLSQAAFNGSHYEKNAICA